jgi:hypothetical protein
LEVTSPIDGQTVSDGTITVMGTATDAGRGDNGISSVTAGGVRASGDTASGSAVANWNRSVTLVPGPNGIEVIAKDSSPNLNATSQIITVYYQPPPGLVAQFSADRTTGLAQA